MNKEQKRFVNLVASLNYTGDLAYYSVLHYNPLDITKDRAKKLLEYWGIVDAETAHAKLKWFLEEGLRKDFDRMKNTLLFISAPDREQWISSLEDEKTRNQYKVVNRYLHKLSSKTIAGTDYGFCTMFAQNAWMADYITSEDAYEYGCQAGRRAQKDFSKWSDFLISHSAGGEFNKENEEASVAFMKSQQVMLTRILTAPTSPIRKISWNTNLVL